MSDDVYIAMSGAAARLAELDLVADRVANAQTPGYRAAHPTFSAVLAERLGTDRAYTVLTAEGVDLRPGPAIQTGNPLDLYPADGAFLVVRDADGDAYTRDGRVVVDSQRRLTIGGRPLVSTDGNAIVVPESQTPTIGVDGVVRAGEAEIGTLGRVKLEGHAVRAGPTVVRPTKEGRVTPSEARIHAGQLESSGPGALAAAGDLMMVQRSFEFATQAIETYRKMDQRANELGRVR